MSASATRKSAEPLVELVCTICEATYVRRPSKIARARQTFCSRACHHEHMRRTRIGDGNPMFKGADALPNSGRQRAIKRFELPELCEGCGEVPPLDRHHRNGDTNDNRPENIAFLCRRCHVTEDGRLVAFLEHNARRPRAAA